MNKNVGIKALAKSLLYISSAVGIAEMMTSNESIVVMILAIACMISFIVDLRTW